MSKNSAIQRLDCFKTWLSVLENRRKNNQKRKKQPTKNEFPLNYHPALYYNEGNE
jgi:hypothetical protein